MRLQHIYLIYRHRLLRLIIRNSFVPFISILFVGCYDSFSPLEIDLQSTVEPNTTIEHLHTLYAMGTRDVNQELIVSGYVTANDEHDNFYKSFVIESDGYAIEILDGLFNSYVRHPLGSQIILQLNGLSLDRYLGVLRTGLSAPATSSYSLDYMSAEAIVDLHVSVVAFSSEITAQTFTLDQLEESQAGRFISIDGLTLYTEDGIERTWSGYSLFRNQAQESIWCYTSSYANFASEKIPQNEVTLQGILEYGDTDSETDQFIIKLRGAEDCIY
ncbi:MAG: DUF5689 domain-containing protein [Rikenellaceae bacterium]